MIDEAYENLANAIVEQAVSDYRKNPKVRKRYVSRLRKAEARLQEVMETKDQERIRKATSYRNSLQSRIAGIDADQQSIERFFHSEWYQMLTRVDGDMILQALRMEIQE